MMIDMDHVSGLIRAAVEAKILPRFRNLAAGEIAQKGPNDPVTIADIEAEEMLSRLLLEAYPETLVIGEELVSREPATLDALLGDTPVWVIDPVDGTMNFADGNPVFGTILAYVVGGQTKAGWIHDPINSVTVTALLGGGAWSDGRRLEVDKATPLNRSPGRPIGRRKTGWCPIRAWRHRGCSGNSATTAARRRTTSIWRSAVDSSSFRRDRSRGTMRRAC